MLILVSSDSPRKTVQKKLRSLNHFKFFLFMTRPSGQWCFSVSWSKTANKLLCAASFMDWLTNQRSPRAVQTKPEFRAGHGSYTGCLSGRSKQQAAWTEVFYKARAVKVQEDILFKFFSKWTSLDSGGFNTQPDLDFGNKIALARLSLSMVLMRGMITTFMRLRILVRIPVMCAHIIFECF